MIKKRSGFCLDKLGLLLKGGRSNYDHRSLSYCASFFEQNEIYLSAKDINKRSSYCLGKLFLLLKGGGIGYDHCSSRCCASIFDL